MFTVDKSRLTMLLNEAKRLNRGNTFQLSSLDSTTHFLSNFDTITSFMDFVVQQRRAKLRDEVQAALREQLKHSQYEKHIQQVWKSVNMVMSKDDDEDKKRR